MRGLCRGAPGVVPARQARLIFDVTANEILSELAAIRAEVAEIKTLFSIARGEVIKEAYTVEEVAKRIGLAPYTVRQACNKKRIKTAYKGRDRAWRIPHAELLAIQNDGMPRGDGS